MCDMLEQRIAAIKKLWVPSAALGSVAKVIAAMIDEPDDVRPTNLALISPANHGKSHLLDYIATRRNGDAQAEGSDRIPVVSILMPETPDPSAIVREFLSRLGAVHRGRRSLVDLWRALEVHVTELGVRLLTIDDAQNAAVFPNKSQAQILNILRGVGSRLRRPLVLAGTSLTQNLLDSDVQLRSRFRRAEIPKLTAAEDLQRFLKTFSERLPLEPKPSLADPELAMLVADLVGGEIGSISKLVKAAAIEALRRGSPEIDANLLRQVSVEVPSTHWLG